MKSRKHDTDKNPRKERRNTNGKHKHRNKKKPTIAKKTHTTKHIIGNLNKRNNTRQKHIS